MASSAYGEWGYGGWGKIWRQRPLPCLHGFDSCLQVADPVGFNPLPHDG
jgi:hypothetical protein